MSKLNQNILDAIKEGKGVDTAMIPGHVDTPKMPADVMDVKSVKGYEFKKTINAERFIAWIETIAQNNQNQNADIAEKAIAGSQFAVECYLAQKSIKKHEKNIAGERYSGFVWNYQTGTPKSVSLEGDMIDRAANAFAQAMETMIVPIEAKSKKLPTVIDPEEINRQEEIVEYLSTRD